MLLRAGGVGAGEEQGGSMKGEETCVDSMGGLLEVALVEGHGRLLKSKHTQRSNTFEQFQLLHGGLVTAE